MAFINAKTFEIIHNDQNVKDIYRDFRTYFHVDEMIALPVQALNRKGYRTHSCCSGHPFKEYSAEDIVFATMIDDELARRTPPLKFSHIEEFKEKSGWRTSTFAGNVIMLPRVSYINFDGDIALPPVPEGFVVRRNEAVDTPITHNRTVINMKRPAGVGIEKYYDSELSVYDYFAEIVSAMRTLHEWALSLPQYEGD